jgi:carboxymethylenebutenolidase
VALREYLVQEVKEDFSDGMLTRRDALRRLTLLGVTVSAAVALLDACGGNDSSSSPAPSAAAPTGGGTATRTPGPAASRASLIRFQGPAGELQGAFAPASQPKGAVLVIHENRGLTPHFFDVPGRLSEAGYTALCVDLLSRQGGTASLPEAGSAPAALAQAPQEQLTADLQAGITELQRRTPGKRVGVVGFCFGGGMTWNLLDAGEARLTAAVPFYGPAPDSPDFRRAKAAVLAIYGGLDTRVTSTSPEIEAALRQARLPYQIKVYPDANHAFFNDTGDRYNPTAAAQAYQALLDWYGRYVAT